MNSPRNTRSGHHHSKLGLGSKRDFVRRFAAMSQNACVHLHVMTEAGNCRFLTGTWETPEFRVQHAIDSLSLAPRTGRYDGLREPVHALLSFSEAAMDRNGLQRHTGSLVQPQPLVELPDGDELDGAVQTVRLRTGRLTSSLEAFTISANEIKNIGNEPLGNSRLTTQHQSQTRDAPS